MSPVHAASQPDRPDPDAAEAALAVRRLGRMDYRDAWNLQRDIVDERADGRIPDTLLLLSHPPVVTLGRGGSPAHVVATAEELAERRVEFVQTDRGGDVTFHGPGQIVGYPIVDLSRRGRDLHRYMRDVEETLIRALDRFGIDADRIEGLTGVWVDGAKVAAIGIRVSRWITHHGFALNVDTDLSYFDLIVPCGIADRRVTSMEELLGRPVDRAEVEAALEAAFAEVFQPGNEQRSA